MIPSIGVIAPHKCAPWPMGSATKRREPRSIAQFSGEELWALAVAIRDWSVGKPACADDEDDGNAGDKNAHGHGRFTESTRLVSPDKAAQEIVDMERAAGMNVIPFNWPT